MKIIIIYRINKTLFQKFVSFADRKSQCNISNYLINSDNLFIISLLYYCTCFEHYMLIIGKSKLYFTASGIVTTVDSRPVNSYLSINAPEGHLNF